MKVTINTNADTNHKSFNAETLQLLHQRFNAVIAREEIGFFHLSSADRHLEECQNIYDKFQTKKYFVQIGIGGSALGPQMLVDALGDQSKCEILFMDNTDAEYIYDVLGKIKSPKDSLFYVVSKSGGTAETVANFAIAKNFLLENGISEKDLNQYFVFCTDNDKGHLRELANNENYATLEVPSDLGGRFSVLSPVGILPALFAQINCEELIRGAKELAAEIANAGQAHDLFSLGAHLNYLMSECKPSVNQTVLMPYSSKLKNLSHWFVQLWGESLGKYSQKSSSHVGLTPIPAYGATDQHSQMQLFMEGPNDKVLMLLEVEKRNQDYPLQANINMQPAKELSKYSLNQLIKAQIDGTLKALNERERNVVHIKIAENNPLAMGQLIMYFECLTALMGEYLDINAFDQPGVELGKKFAYEYLKNLA